MVNLCDCDDLVYCRMHARAFEMLALLKRIAQEWPDVAEATTAREIIREIEEEPPLS